jgi:hypothetical protein
VTVGSLGWKACIGTQTGGELPNIVQAPIAIDTFYGNIAVFASNNIISGNEIPIASISSLASYGAFHTIFGDCHRDGNHNCLAFDEWMPGLGFSTTPNAGWLAWAWHDTFGSTATNTLSTVSLEVTQNSTNPSGVVMPSENIAQLAISRADKYPINIAGNFQTLSFNAVWGEHGNVSHYTIPDYAAFVPQP